MYSTYSCNWPCWRAEAAHQALNSRKERAVQSCEKDILPVRAELASRGEQAAVDLQVRLNAQHAREKRRQRRGERGGRYCIRGVGANVAPQSHVPACVTLLPPSSRRRASTSPPISPKQAGGPARDIAKTMRCLRHIVVESRELVLELCAPAPPPAHNWPTTWTFANHNRAAKSDYKAKARQHGHRPGH